MPEYGDTENARSWSNANVYIAFDDGSGFPAVPGSTTSAFGAGWELVGLLDGGQGFVEGYTETVTDNYAWGSILVSSRRSEQKTTKSFTALETNEVTDRLLHIRDGVQYRETAERVKIAFEKIDGAQGVTERQISYATAEVTLNGDRTDNETTPQSIPFIATIFPGNGGELFTIQRGATSSS